MVTIFPRLPEKPALPSQFRHVRFKTHAYARNVLNIMDSPCKHPKVRVVAREEDAEFVECQECGEVFDSGEFRDMAIEEQPQDEEDVTG